MNWLQNLSIRHKVSAIAVIGIIGFLAFLALNFRLTSDVQDKLVTIVSSDLPALHLSHELQARASDIENGFQTTLANPSEAGLEKTLRTATALSRQLLELKNTRQEDAVGIEKLRESLKTYVEVATRQIQARMRNENDISADDVVSARTMYEKQQAELVGHWLEKFNERITAIQNSEKEIITIGFSIGITVSLLLLLVSMITIRMMTQVLNNAVVVAEQIAHGNLNQDIHVAGTDEAGHLMQSLRIMRDALLKQHHENRIRSEEQRMLNELNELMRGDQALDTLTDNILRYLANELDAAIGAFYLFQDDALHLQAGYAIQYRSGNRNRFAIGETIVGQCAQERKPFLLTDLPDDYVKIGSGTGIAPARSVVVLPVFFNDELKGVIELGSFRNFGGGELHLLNRSAEGIGIAINSAAARIRMQEMLQQTREQAEALRQQQFEMEKINLELEERSRDLDHQKNEILQKNHELERSRKVLLEKSEALEASGRYKTQFLSTMSHELRTPLNSILILSQALADNKSGNLSAKDVEHASVIHSSGSDLLSLINDILDLSKVEEGKMELVYEDIAVRSMTTEISKRFQFIVNNKGLDFTVTVEDDVPPTFVSDIHRLNQILKNFISNAIKFTDTGGIHITVHRPRAPFIPVRNGLEKNTSLVIAVRDTGAGIPKNKQQIIFEAFKQADGTTSRKYGGTGLGLTISRQLAHLLGGEISVFSDGAGTGSTFAILLPLSPSGNSDNQKISAPEFAAPDISPEFPDAPVHHEDPLSTVKNRTQKTDRLLIVEDDEKFAHILSDLINDSGMSCDVMHNGQDALLYLDHYLPQALILDVSLPDMPGWEVIKKIKSNPNTRYIPVHVVSAMPEKRLAETLGAKDFLEKPVSQNDVEELLSRIKEEISGAFNRVLIVEDNVKLHDIISEQFAGRDMEAQFVETGAEALELVHQQLFDCLIVDLKLPDGDGVDLLKKIRAIDAYAATPVIVFTAEDLLPEREFEVSKYADRVILKSNQAMERLLDATQLFLDAVSHPESAQEDTKPAEANPPLPSVAAESIAPLRDYLEGQEALLAGCHVLLVDDDVRNIYSTSAVLEDADMEVTPAMSGAEALDKLASEPNIRLVLMDIMMPEMDGYETMRRIRQMPGMQALPIIALTAKAMQEDRQLCIDAGASDYLTKPVDVELLKRMMATWLVETTTAN